MLDATETNQRTTDIVLLYSDHGILTRREAVGLITSPLYFKPFSVYNRNIVCSWGTGLRRTNTLSTSPEATPQIFGTREIGG